MAESFITQCPHCGTSFRVRTEQLSVANGSVRCGACLQVFSARNHVVTGGIPPKTPATKPTPIKPATEKPKQFKSFDDNLDPPSAKTEPTFEKPVSKEPPAEKTKEPDFEEFFAAEEDDDAEFIFADSDEDDNDAEDEFIFSDGPNDKLFDEDEQEEGLGELSESFLSLSGRYKTAQKPDHFQQEISNSESDTFEDDDEIDESWAESILQEIEEEEQQKKAVFDTEHSQKQEIEAEAIPIEPTPVASILDFDDDFSIPQSASQIVTQASQEIEHDFPFEDRFQKFRPLGWLLIILLTVLVIAQLAWIQRDTYARMDQWRGIYEAVCDKIGCTLPDQVDLNSIRTSVRVREHKDSSLSDIYVVDVVLTNNAPFKQAFPALVLQYTDVNGQLIADQVFQPNDYLKGEMTGVKQMPISTRIYVALAIKKPGKNAVNYQLLLTPASN